MAITFDTFLSLQIWERGLTGTFGRYADLAPRVSSYTIRSGKGDRFTQFQSAVLNVTFNNADGFFDPTFETVFPQSGGLPAKFGAPIARWVRAGTRAGQTFNGYITDWDFSYSPDGNAIVTMTAMDIFSFLATKPLPQIEAPAELSGRRVRRVLEASGVASFSIGSEFGLVKLQAETIPEGTLALDYLNSVLETEWGLLTTEGSASIKFTSRIRRPRPSGSLSTTSDGILRLGNAYIPFTDIAVSYGTDLMYNRVFVQNEGGALVDVSNQESIDYNGEKQLSLTGLKGELDSDALNLGLYFADEYSTPKLRIEAVSFIFQKYNLSFIPGTGYVASPEQYDLTRMRLGEIVYVEFQPPGGGDPIQQHLLINRIEYSGVPGELRLTYGLEPFAQYLLLDDTTFGKLDEGNVLGQDYRQWVLGYDFGGAVAEIYSRLSAGLVLG